MMMLIVRLLLAQIIGCGAGKLSRQLTEIEDDPVPCPVCPHSRLLQTQIPSDVPS
jgi:hypothetical protein